jgi:predicted TIM-barrel fold metal-dependent hydrolase
MARRKEQHESPVESPIAFNPGSNGEFCPRPDGPRERRALRMFRELVEEKHKRAGMTRREFADSACGMAAALFVINNIYGCSDDERNGTADVGGGAGRGSSGAGGDSSHSGSGGSTSTGSGGRAGASGGGAPAAIGGSGGSGGPMDAGFGVEDAMMEDPQRACEVLLDPQQFVLDIQTHTSTPLTGPWTTRELPTTAADFINTIFASSETSVAVLTGIPSVRDLGLPNVAARTQFQELVDQLAGPRLIHHANLKPEMGASELEYMEEVMAAHAPTAWKVYPHSGRWRLDSEEVGMPFVEKARALKLPLIAAHRGLADNGDYSAPSSPIDLVNAARQYPDVNFICYHSGYESNTDENHAFDPNNANPRGVDRLIKAVLDNELEPNKNVYAELGTTWNSVMRSPEQAAHVLGKLLRYVGEDRVVWGTDCVFHGSPQAQISALRTFQISDSMQQQFGYPALTPELKAKILGRNAAPLYGVDPVARRCAIEEDAFAYLRKSYLDDPRSVPVPREQRLGPRTRREFLAFRRFEDYFNLG